MEPGSASDWCGPKLRWQVPFLTMPVPLAFCCSDTGGHTRFVVRGRVGATPATLLAEVKAEAAAASRSAGASAATVEIIGDGVMEW